MRASEILRKLADVIDSAEAGEQMQQTQSAPQNVNTVELVPVSADNADHTTKITMLSPLQQDLEIKKKVAGVDNAFDNQEFDQDGEQEVAPDELEIIKKSAGLSSGHSE